MKLTIVNRCVSYCPRIHSRGVKIVSGVSDSKSLGSHCEVNNLGMEPLTLVKHMHPLPPQKIING